MKIHKLTLANFRSYKDPVSIENLSDVNVFIGQNIAGKSNILEALQYFRGLAIGQLTRTFGEVVFDRNPKLDIKMAMTIVFSRNERTGIIERLYRGNQRFKIPDILKTSLLSTFSWEIVIRSDGVMLSGIRVSKPVKGDFTIYRAELRNRDSRARFALDLEAHCNSVTTLDDQSFTDPQLKDLGAQSPANTTTAVEFSNLPESLRDLIHEVVYWLGNFIVFPPVRQVVHKTALGEEQTLLPTGTNLVKFLNSLLGNDPDKFVALKDKVVQIAPLVKAILAPARGNEATVEIKEEGLQSSTNISNVSFGLTQILLLTMGLVTAPEGSVIMIEEPELHLHAGSQRRLFELIQSEARDKQFFITTHSSIFSASKETVRTYLITKKKGVSSVKPIMEKDQLRLVKNALGHRNSDLFGYEGVIFVEGDSEERAIPIIAEGMGYDFVEMGIKIINVGGSAKVARIGEYLHYLKDSDVLAYVIADGSKEVSKKIKDWEREGILREQCSVIWPQEFEDCFDSETLAKAIAEYAKELNVDITVPIEDLSKAKTEGVPVAKVIQKLLHEQGLPDLKKPILSEKIAFVLRGEMASENHQKSPVEREVAKIVGLIEESYQ